MTTYDLLPPESERPVCVTVAWLNGHPTNAHQLDYYDGSLGCWLPADSAGHDHDPGGSVQVRPKVAAP